MSHRKPLLAALAFFLMVSPACRENPTGPQQYDWPRSDPAEQGFSTQWLDRAYDKALTIEGLLSLLVVRNGFLVVEHYFGDMDKDAAIHIRSVTKSVVSILTGIAIKEGFLESVDQKLGQVLPPHYRNDLDSTKSEITLKQLLTMTPGFLWEENGDLQAEWVDSDDMFGFALNLPLDHQPGEIFEYNSSVPHLLSGILSYATGKTMLDFAQEYLFGPLGVVPQYWSQAPEGINLGGYGLGLTPRGMARIGELYLNKGTIDGKQILSAEWVAASTKNQVIGANYGYLWWIDTFRGHEAFMARGAQGQMIYVFPGLEMVVVTTGDLPQATFVQSLDQLLRSYILPAAE